MKPRASIPGPALPAQPSSNLHDSLVGEGCAYFLQGYADNSDRSSIYKEPFPTKK